MATKKPLYQNNGVLSEVAAGDTIDPSTLGTGTPTGSKYLRDDGVFSVPPGGGGSVSLTEVTLDFGSFPVGSKSFSFSDASATTASKIIISPSAKPAASRQSDELEMDSFMCSAVCEVDGTIKAFIVAAPGPVSGPYKFNYIMG